MDIFVKINPANPENERIDIGVIQLALDVIDSNGNSGVEVFELVYDDLLKQDDLWVFRTFTEEIEIKGVKALRMKRLQR